MSFSSENDSPGSRSRRVQKVERELRELISAYLISGFKRSLPGIVSIPHVRATSDLKSAKVYVSLIGVDPESEQYGNTLEVLNEYAFEVQKHISKSLSMKFCPKLRFFSDELQQEAYKVEGLIRKISQERQEDDVTGEEDS